MFAENLDEDLSREDVKEMEAALRAAEARLPHPPLPLERQLQFVYSADRKVVGLRTRQLIRRGQIILPYGGVAYLKDEVRPSDHSMTPLCAYLRIPCHVGL